MGNIPVKIGIKSPNPGDCSDASSNDFGLRVNSQSFYQDYSNLKP